VIASTTGVQAFLFGCLSRRERFKTGVARIECVNARQQKHRKEERDDGKRTACWISLLKSLQVEKSDEWNDVARQIESAQ
jgi:hypothetical protein